MATTRPDARAVADAWRRELPGVPTRSVAVVWAVKTVASELRRARERALHAQQVDPATLDLLSTLRRSGSPYTLTTRALAERCLVSAGAVSQRVARAEEDGLVVRTPGPGRSVEVALTGAGHRVVERVAQHVLDADDALTAALTDDELGTLEALLGRWADAIRGPATAGRRPDA
ncbi:MarR family winged helix-turn-helix transcriptional regulator [Cellulomonas fimi]|uniref:Regulatory protein MarR n=1 Tax=Cellulomonas fimi (strain ATCC 484 / DSM 20113 / JCM 1341 / CCUG 24087 / LMG 16345 / NBRC 15513 / NCIMB 8980 / NCTC 7547 / NRS-133) TaxID=590998 RepID=F4H031_CELFA|nr:MarR family transcriptional regulator [Cellulomonas fimi]AEE44953.1 regulatory protein MarR [Cellulomonas fimi ATCC 484]NNH07224.1 MarR family transcriptional regulator [Cellulomonas fimi]VEH27781.1 MarR family [Cellulomonas fimi]